jgi:hypothetical protein
MSGTGLYCKLDVVAAVYRTHFSLPGVRVPTNESSSCMERLSGFKPAVVLLAH